MKHQKHFLSDGWDGNDCGYREGWDGNTCCEDVARASVFVRDGYDDN